MLSVLIVDDEEKIGKLLKHIIDWKSIGLYILDIVSSGRQALEIAKQEKPDILITDIKMPELNGMELVEAIHKASPLTRFIVISGYRKFEYAKRMMQYDVEDYLLKPIKKSELLAVLNKIICVRNETDQKNKYIDGLEQNLELLRHEKQLHFFQEFVAENKKGSTVISNLLLQESGIVFPHDFYHVFCIYIDIKGTVPEQFNVSELLQKNVLQTATRYLKKQGQQLICIPCPQELVCILNFKNGQEKNIIRDLYHIIYDIKNISDSRINLAATIGIKNEPCQKPEVLPEALTAARKALAHRIIAGTNQVIILSDNALAKKELSLTPAFCEEIHEAMREKNHKKMDQLYEKWKAEIKKQDFSYGHEYLLSSKNWIHALFCDSVMLHLGESAGELMQTYENKLKSCYTKQLLFSSMKQLYEILLKKLIEADEKKNSRPIYMVQQYIDKNYANPITLEDASRCAGFSSAYLSSLFKKETGKNFSEYLSEVRIGNAKKLLKNPQLTIFEIARAVGYADEKYFFRVFKKYTGLTPKEFKQLYY